jgi:hypothetical protein
MRGEFSLEKMHMSPRLLKVVCLAVPLYQGDLLCDFHLLEVVW